MCICFLVSKVFKNVEDIQLERLGSSEKVWVNNQCKLYYATTSCFGLSLNNLKKIS